MYNYSNSPFGAVLQPYSSLPQALQEHFLVDADANYDVVLDGHLTHIWYRPGWLWPIFWLLAKLGILVSHFGHNIPTQLVVVGHRGVDGRPRHHWKRTFRFNEQTTQQFNATIVYDPLSKQAIDWLGPYDVILMAWEISFVAPHKLELVTSGWGIKIGKLELWLPQWLWRNFFVKVVALETASPDNLNDTIHINLTIEQRFLGKIFGYEGTFKLRRQNKS